VKLTNEFTVPAPVERAWEVLLDMERVAPCLPGAAIESGEGDEYTGTMAVKIGPITARYRGTVKVEEADEAARRTVMRAQARDQRGQGTAAATITSTMETVPEGTRVVVETDMRITGPAAQFGRGVMQDVSAKLMGRFAECLAEEIAAAPPVDTGAAAGADAPVASGTAGIELPPGPAAAAAEAAARAQAAPPSGAAAGGTPPAADDIASPPRARPTAEVLDLGEATREALLKRTLPVLAGLAVTLGVVAALRRRSR
jgi:carbon monoxide dehydrogenase subunit G